MSTVRGQQQGLTYLEVLLAMLLVAAIAVPLGDALYNSTVATEVTLAARNQLTEVRGEFETALARSYSDLLTQARTAPGGARSVTTAGGHTVVIEVLLYDIDNADADNNTQTGTDDDILLVRASVPGSVVELQTLVVP